MADLLYKRPNHVPELQRAYQTSHKPIWLRGTRGPFYYGVYLSLFSAGVLGTGYGIFSVIKGKPSSS